MLLQAARALATDETVCVTCRAFADEMVALGGPARAAAAVERIIISLRDNSSGLDLPLSDLSP